MPDRVSSEVPIDAVASEKVSGDKKTKDEIATLNPPPASLALSEVTFQELLGGLIRKNFTQKDRVIDEIAKNDDERVPDVLQALLEGRLYYEKKTKSLLYVDVSASYMATEVVTNESRGNVKKRSIKKIGVNNKLRGKLRSLIASYKLTSKNRSVRLAAARTLIKTPKPEFLPILDKALSVEKDSGVQAALVIARAMIRLKSEDLDTQLVAVGDLEGVNDKYVMTRLEQLSATELDPRLRLEIDKALEGMHTRARLFKFGEDLFFGVSLGSVLLLAAVGLAITFGVMGVINMAHGEMIMLGAYTTYVVQLAMPNHIGLSLVVAVPAAFMVAGAFGVAIERGVIRFLYGRPLETLLATFGVSLILQQLVRSIFSPLNRSVISPEWMSGSWQVNGMLSLTYNRMYIVLFSFVVLLALMALLKKTSFGLKMRAVTQNRAMAGSMGIRTARVDAFTFGLGSGIAGIAGVALSQLTNVGPNLGQSYIIDSFMVVVFGGVGNLMGTFVAAMTLGIVNKFAEPVAGAVLGKIIILVLVILFIQRRPRGLFALKGRFVDS